MPRGLRSESFKSRWDLLAYAASLPGNTYPFKNISASQELLSGRYIYLGFTLVNSATVAGTLIVHDGQDTSGAVLGNGDFAASASLSEIPGGNGILTDIGIYLEITAGTISGSIWAIPLWHYNITPPGE